MLNKIEDRVVAIDIAVKQARKKLQDAEWDNESTEALQAELVRLLQAKDEGVAYDIRF